VAVGLLPHCSSVADVGRSVDGIVDPKDDDEEPRNRCQDPIRGDSIFSVRVSFRKRIIYIKSRRANSPSG
jgi:hypothetical protein